MALKPAHLQWSEDGVLRSAEYDDVYFLPRKGPGESQYVFLEKNRLPERFSAAQSGFRIAELGFGTGLNFLLTAQLWRERGGAGELLYTSFEKHPLTREDLARVLAFWPEFGDDAAALLAQYPPALEGFYHLRFPGGIRLMLVLGDVAATLPEVSGAFDAWYLDGFSPAKNPAMWDAQIFPLIAARTTPGGTLTTFSVAAAVLGALRAAGFSAEKVRGFGVKRKMTVAQLPGEGPSPARKKVIVLGAGLGGAAAAYACAEKGCDVVVIDRQNGPAMETSGNPAGVLYPKLTASPSPAGLWSQHGFFFTRNLVTALGLSSWNPCGVEHLDVDADEAARHAKMAASGQWPEDFLSYAPGGMTLPFGGFLSPPELCARLLDHPRITTEFARSITSLAALETDAIVMALANSTLAFEETAWLPLKPIRGQLSLLRATPSSAALRHVLCHDGLLTPAVAGLHIAGATFSRESITDTELRDDDHAENLARLEKYAPQYGFTAADIAGGRTGYRAYVPDHLPVAGAAPAYPDTAPLRNLYLSTAFGGQGLAGAPLAGEVVACMITGAPSPIPASLRRYIAPERFILRKKA